MWRRHYEPGKEEAVEAGGLENRYGCRISRAQSRRIGFDRDQAALERSRKKGARSAPTEPDRAGRASRLEPVASGEDRGRGPECVAGPAGPGEFCFGSDEKRPRTRNCIIPSCAEGATRAQRWKLTNPAREDSIAISGR